MTAQVYRLFGAYRFGLALLVLISHAPTWPRPIWGNVALGTVGFFFFSLSGFVIAEALDVFYRDSMHRFVINHFLKIYPTFWVVALLTFLVFTLMGAPVSLNGKVLFANVTILGSFFKFANNRLLITGGWAVIVELIFYILFALVWLSVRRQARPGKGLWLTGALFLLLYVVVTARGDFTHSYSNLRYAPMFIFGASLYWALSRRSIMATVLLAISCGLALQSYWIYASANPGEAAGSSLILFALSLGLFAALSVFNAATYIKRIDRWLGDFTYALYLVNGLVIFVLGRLAIGGAGKFALTLVTGVTLSALIHLGVERPMAKLRARVRGRALYGS